MDYKEKVIALLKSQELSKEQKEKLENIFPELKESEDEKIRKALLDYFSECKKLDINPVHDAQTNTILAWLEKQGEQKPTDKVEPKFKVGDWVVISTSDGEKVVQIDSVEYFKSGEPRYITSEGRWFGNGTKAHLWTIQDAKPGDVLAFYGEYKGNKMLQVGIIERYVGKHGGCSNTFKIYVGVNWENNLQIGEYMGCSDIRPATKEQRDTLMKAMADAGYIFDFKKRELKKIENKNLLLSDFFKAEYERGKTDAQKPAWSEEDEQHIDSLLKRLDGLCRNEFERTRFAINEDKDWLESLKQSIGG